MTYVAGNRTSKWIKKQIGISNQGNPIYRETLIITCKECEQEFEPTERKLIGMKEEPLEPAFLIICPKCGTKQ